MGEKSHSDSVRVEVVGSVSEDIRRAAKRAVEETVIQYRKQRAALQKSEEPDE